MSEFRDASWDYGLEPGESFEPEGWEEEEYDLSLPHVMTALGPIDPGALGFTLLNQRLLRFAPAGQPVADVDLVLDDLAKASSELEGYAVTGGRAIVDISVAGDGRDAGELLFIAQRSPVHLVLSTGASANEGFDGINEIESGMDGSTARAGLITLSGDADRGGLEAIASAHRTTGAPILLRGTAAVRAVDVIATLRNLGVEPAEIIVGELDTESEHLDRLVDSGAFLAFDQWATGNRAADASRATAICTLIGQGLGARILISGELAQRSRRLAYGGDPGLVYFIDEVPLMLMEAGVSALDVRSIFVENVARALTIVRPAD